MKATTGPAAWLIYLAVRYAFALMQVFPIDRNLRTAKALARLWRRIMPRHFGQALTHLGMAYGGRLVGRQLEDLAMRSLEGVVMFAVEVICLPRLMRPYTWHRFVRLRNFEKALELLISGEGAILVTGHYGPFELTGHLMGALGFPVTAVMRPLDNVYLNRFVVRSRRTHGIGLLDKKGATKGAEALLRNGTLLAFIGDQDAGRKGLFVNFFGKPASTYKSIGLLALATGRPIIVGYARRLGDRARYEVGVQRIIQPREWEVQDDPLWWITQTYTAAIEEVVRTDPTQYLWVHRRWKSRPGAKRAVAGQAKAVPCKQS